MIKLFRYWYSCYWFTCCAAIGKTAPSTNGANPDVNLGVSSFTSSNCSRVLNLRQGAMSSVSTSAEHPVWSATRFFTDKGSRCIAHEDNAEPPSKTTLWTSSGETEERKSQLRHFEYRASPHSWRGEKELCRMSFSRSLAKKRRNPDGEGGWSN